MILRKSAGAPAPSGANTCTPRSNTLNNARDASIFPQKSTIAWLATEIGYGQKPPLIGAVSGMLAGLVAITAPSGYVMPWAALVIGLVSRLMAVPGVNAALQRVGLGTAPASAKPVPATPCAMRLPGAGTKPETLPRARSCRFRVCPAGGTISPGHGTGLL